jgi:hypothetical protein
MHPAGPKSGIPVEFGNVYVTPVQNGEAFKHEDCENNMLLNKITKEKTLKIIFFIKRYKYLFVFGVNDSKTFFCLKKLPI